MIVKKCERCGNDISVEKPKEVREIKCKHCNREYEVDKKTTITAVVIVALVIFVLAFLTTALAAILNISPYILLIPLVVLSLFIFNLSYYFLAKINKVTYKALK